MYVSSADTAVVPAALSPVTPPLAAAERAWTVAGIHAAGLYLTAPAGSRIRVVPVIGTGAYDLPTAVRTRVPAAVFTAGLRIGDRVATAPDRLLLPAAELRIMRMWRPQRISPAPTPPPTLGTAAAPGAAAALGTAGADLPAALAALQPGIADAASSAEQIVRTALTGSRDSETGTGPRSAALAEQIAALIGRGPGLTPSGDDVLCGIALALRLRSAWDTLDRFRTALTPQLSSTTAISASLLETALDGWCTTPVAKALSAAQSSDSAAFAQHLGGIGHTSGHDLGAGVLAACRVLTQPSPQPAGGSPDRTEGEVHALSR